MISSTFDEGLQQSASGLPTICIVAHNAYGALIGNGGGHIGGVEHQTSMFAKWLVSQGYRVTLLTWDEGQGASAQVDGVRVVSICRQNQGLMGIRFVHPRWTGLCRALSTADAEVYYHNGAEAVSGQIGMWCRRNGRRFVFSAAADADVDPSMPALTRRRDRWLFKRGLRAANAIIVQTKKQQALLRDGHGLDSVVLPMPCQGFVAHPEERRAAAGRQRALWVGRVVPVKRLEWLLDVAASRPGIAFDVVGPAEHDEYAKPLLARATSLRNVIVHGRQSRAAMPSFYQRASCLISTSLREGFPNTFLEAWSHGLPVLSTVEIDGLLQEGGLGRVAHTPEKLALALDALLGDCAAREKMSVQARRYYETHHRADAALPKFAECLNRVAISNQ